jgi:hypothetical protein
VTNSLLFVVGLAEPSQDRNQRSTESGTSIYNSTIFTEFLHGSFYAISF